MGNKNSDFIWWTGIGIVIFVVFAFGLAAYVQPHRPARYVKPTVIMHIVLIVGWLSLFIYQSGLAIKGEIQRHRSNLWLGSLLVPLIMLQAMYLTWAWGDPVRFVGESRDVVVFLILFFLAIWSAKRGRYEVHKRFMLIATLNLIGPAYTRLGFVFEWGIPVGILLTFLTWIIVPVAYDLTSRGKVHRASIWGIAISILSFGVMIGIILSPVMDWIKATLFVE